MRGLVHLDGTAGIVVSRVPAPRLQVDHPDLPEPLHLGPGAVHHLDDAVARPVVDALLGRERRAVVHLDGHRLRARSVASRVRRGLAVVSGAPVAGEVTVHDHLAAVLGDRRADALLAGAPLLAGRGDDPAGVLSGGERRVLAWLRARATDPRAVLLDRAGEGLDVGTLAWAGGVVRAWVAAGVAVVVRAGRAEERRWGTDWPRA